ncbi:hypothetical protein [Nitrosopumilus sp.]|uniref:hypothetical protein n=1 Tax=Nitrosopumilus sp. TaxID=2024843 RepID=UPI003B5C19AA
MAKGKVNPRNQMIYAVSLAMIPAIGFIMFTVIAVRLELLWGPIGYWNERFAMYGWSAILVFIPFIRISKTFKVIPYVFSLWILSSMLIFFSGFSEMAIGVSLTLMVPLVMAIGHSMSKWSKQWNERVHR